MFDEPERQAAPAEFYRWRAEEYRRIARETADPEQAEFFRNMAIMFEREAAYLGVREAIGL